MKHDAVSAATQERSELAGAASARERDQEI